MTALLVDQYLSIAVSSDKYRIPQNVQEHNCFDKTAVFLYFFAEDFAIALYMTSPSCYNSIKKPFMIAKEC